MPNGQYHGGAQEIPNPATVSQHRGKGMWSPPKHIAPYVLACFQIILLACDDWSPRPHTLSSSSLWGGCGIKGGRRRAHGGLHADGGGCHVHFTVELEIRTHCGASIHCPQRMVCWLIDSVWAKNFGQGLYHCHAWFFVYMTYILVIDV